MLSDMQTPKLSRRGFLATIPAVLAIPAHAATPIPAGCRDAMLRQLGAPDCWSAAKQVGAEVMEVTVDDKFAVPLLTHPQQPYSVATPEGIQQLSADLKAAGVKISAFCVASKFDSRPDFEIDFLTKLGGIAQQMGIKAMRIDVVSYRIPPEQFLDSAVASVNKLMDATKGIDVRFGMENHGPCGNNPDFLKPMLDRVSSNRFGVTLDTGNFYWYGHPLEKVYELIEYVAPRAFHTHCKSINYPADQREVKRPMGW